MTIRAYGSFLLLLTIWSPVIAKVVEEQTTVLVKVLDQNAQEISHEIVVTLFRDDEAKTPYPLLVFNHGRDGTFEGRQKFGRVRYDKQLQWLAELGYLVAIPTRISYGVTGGPDVEDSGPCNDKNFAPGFLAAAKQTIELVGKLSQRRDVNANQVTLVGWSFGGMTSLAVASLNALKVNGIVVFAPGSGANPPGPPCGVEGMTKLFMDYGRVSRVPTLWISTENDSFFPSAVENSWFDAYRSGGAVGKHVMTPPHGENGHFFFVRGSESWRPLMLDFLTSNQLLPVARPLPVNTSSQAPIKN